LGEVVQVGRAIEGNADRESHSSHKIAMRGDPQ
jgi:hypothetical protein